MNIVVVLYRPPIIDLSVNPMAIGIQFAARHYILLEDGDCVLSLVVSVGKNSAYCLPSALLLGCNQQRALFASIKGLVHLNCARQPHLAAIRQMGPQFIKPYSDSWL